MHLVTTWFGSFLCEEGRVVGYKLFPRNAEEIANRMMKIEDWKILEEEKDLIRDLEEFFVSEKRLERAGGTFSPESLEFLKAEDYGFDVKLLHDSMLEVAKRKMRGAIGADDHITQAVGCIEDLAEAYNLLSERLHEWYGLHFPELSKMVEEDQFLTLIAKYGDRGSIPLEFKESIGSEISKEDKKAMMGLAQLAKDIGERKRSLEGYIEEMMRRVAPNVAHLAGPLIGAKLIALAGGLEELARCPSSTIQLLGAEKALFRHLKEGKKPPKHGVLFQHPWVHRAPYWQRGMIARALASKISIASRADFYSKRFIAEELKEALEKVVKEVKRKYPQPPSKKQMDMRKRHKMKVKKFHEKRKGGER